MYKLVIFDLDGTLLDTDLLLVLTWVELYKRYKPNGIPRIDDIVTFSGPPIKQSLHKVFPKEDVDKLYKSFNEISQPLYDEYLTVYPGGKELIEKLKKDNVRLAVLTSKHKGPTKHALEVVGLDNTFDVIVTSNDVIKTKPDKEGVEKILSFYPELSKKDVLYIGDNTSDYLTCLNSSIDSMIVTWGPRKLDKNIKPTYFIDSFDDFYEVINHGKN